MARPHLLRSFLLRPHYNYERIQVLVIDQTKRKGKKGGDFMLVLGGRAWYHLPEDCQSCHNPIVRPFFFFILVAGRKGNSGSTTASYPPPSPIANTFRMRRILACGHEGESGTCSGMSLVYGCLCFASLEGRVTSLSWLVGGTHNCSWMDGR